MELVVMRVAFQVIDDLLPVGGKDVLVRAVQPLIDLDLNQPPVTHIRISKVHLPMLPYRIQLPARILERKAIYWCQLWLSAPHFSLHTAALAPMAKY